MPCPLFLCSCVPFADCQDTYKEHPHTTSNSVGRVEHLNITLLERCKYICINLKDCYALEFTANKQCFLQMSKDYISHAETNIAGITQYRKIVCGGTCCIQNAKYICLVSAKYGMFFVSYFFSFAWNVSGTCFTKAFQHLAINNTILIWFVAFVCHVEQVLVFEM